MRQIINFLIIILFITCGCEKYRSPADIEKTDGFSIRIGSDFTIGPEEIDYYDFSTHLIYLKDGISIPSKYDGGVSFAVFAGTEKIYSGLIVPGFSCLLQEGAVINSQPFSYPDFIIAIEFIQVFDSAGNSNPDPRGDKRIVKVLKKYNQFHEGLSGNIESIQINGDQTVTMILKMQNTDTYNYYILDPDKMGFSLFHFFTNGLYLWNMDHTMGYVPENETIQPDIWNTWEKDWLTLIRSEETKYISLTYSYGNQIPPGSYTTAFEYPGLSFQVKKEDIKLEGGRIWLGKLDLRKEIEVD